MVCDHWRGHALRCNEAPVCDQCQMSGTPCIKRWCPQSPCLKDLCEDGSCRYPHGDYLPVPCEPYSVEDYIVLPGNLRRYRADGKLFGLDWNDDEDIDWGAFEEGVKEIQNQVRKDFTRWVSEGRGTLESLHCYCGEDCGKTLGDGFEALS